jgi:HK97 family phage major capsid protein
VPAVADRSTVPDLVHVEKRGGPAVASTPGAVDTNAIRFRVSNEDVDAFGDIVVQAGLTFPPTLPAVADHSPSLEASVGEWRSVERAGPETFATLRLLPAGVSRMADLVRALHQGGYPLASSVHFDIQRADIEPLMRTDANGHKTRTGSRYLRGLVREVSITQFPANPAAVAVARSLGFNDAEVAALSRPEPAPASIARTSAVAGAPASRGLPMDFSEQIAAAQAAHEAAQAALATAGTNFEHDASEANLAAVQRATTEVDQVSERLVILRNAQTAAARRAAAAPAPAPAAPVTAVSRAVATVAGTPPASPAIIAHRTTAADMEPRGTRLARLIMAAGVARSRRISVEQAVVEQLPNDAEMIRIARSAANVADTTTAGWAAELVRTEIRAMLDSTQMPNSIWPALSAAGTSLNFAGAHSVLIPQMNIGTTALGAWVGEGGMIPVVQGTFSSKRLYAYKLGGVIPITKELQRMSDPDAVATMREMLRQYLSNLLDSSMIDTSAEITGVRPAGLLNGVAPITGTAGGGYEALRGDLEAVTNAFTAAGVGSRPVLLVPQSKQFRLKTMVNALGQLVFPNFENEALGFQVIPSQFVPPTTAIAVAAEKFASAIDPLEFDTSEEATLSMANADATAPTQAGAAPGGGALGTQRQVVPDGGIPVSGGTGASTTGYTAVSMYQAWSVALRLVIPASYGVTRAGAVQEITGITW